MNLSININWLVLPIVVASYIITVFCLLLTYKLFGKPSKTKFWLFHYLNSLIKHKLVRQYFSFAYYFHTWLFCVGDNKNLWFRFIFIINITETLTLLSLIFRFFLVAKTFNFPTYFVILAGILFALNGLFKNFVRSGFLIQHLVHDEFNSLTEWQKNVEFSGNNLFENERQSENYDTREQASQSSYKRYFKGIHWNHIATGLTILTMIVLPLTIEKIRQSFETKARIENNVEKLGRAKLENESAKLEAQAARDRRIAAELDAKNKKPPFFEHQKNRWTK